MEMDLLGGLDDHYFNSLLSEPYSDFSTSPHSSEDTDTLSPSLSPGSEFAFDSHDFGMGEQWNFDTQTLTKEEPVSVNPGPPKSFLSVPDWSAALGQLQSLVPPQTTLLQPLPLQPFSLGSDTSAFLPKTEAPSTKKPRTKRRKVDAEKEVVTATPPASPPHMPYTSEIRLTLTRDELLTLTSAQYEALIAQVRSARDLTLQEKRDIKNNRRLIKNRESAHASRQRKKDYVQELEKKLADLAAENERLVRSITVVQNENSLLRSENEFYKGRAQSAAILPGVVQQGVNFLQTQFQTPQTQTQQRPKTAPAKTGVMLMVLLFSFGIMFGNFGFPTTSQLSQIQSSVPEVLPRVYQREEYKQVGNSPIDFLTEQDAPTNMIRERLRKRMAVNVEESTSSVSEEPKTISTTLSRRLFTFSADTLSQDLTPYPKMNLPPSFFKSNTTYLMCNSVSQVDPTTLLPFDESPDAVKKISFMIPPSSFGGNPDACQNDSELLVVTCEVVDVSMVPITSKA